MSIDIARFPLHAIKIGENQIVVNSKIVNVSNSAITFPGLTNIIFAPLNVIWASREVATHVERQDREGIRESFTLLMSSIAGLLHAIEYSFALINDYVIHYISHPAITMAVATTGYVLCALEFLAESFRFIAQLIFKYRYFHPASAPILTKENEQGILSFIERAEKILDRVDMTDLASQKDRLKRDLAAIRADLATAAITDSVKSTKKISQKIKATLCLYNTIKIRKKYFTLSEADRINLETTQSAEARGFVPPGTADMYKHKEETKLAVQLARKVQPWLYHQIAEKKDQIELDLYSMLEDGAEINLEKLQEAEELMKKIHQQCNKALIINGIALTALAITIAAIYVTSLSLPPLIPLAIGLSVGAIAISAGSLKSVWLPTEGWNIKMSYIIPYWLRQKFGWN